MEENSAVLGKDELPAPVPRGHRGALRFLYIDTMRAHGQGHVLAETLNGPSEYQEVDGVALGGASLISDVESDHTAAG